MPTRQSLCTVRIADTGTARASAGVLSGDFGGLITVSLTYGTGEVEQTGGDPLAVDMLSDELETCTGQIEFHDSPENWTLIGSEELTGKHKLLWIAPTGDATGQTPNNLEMMLEAVFSDSSIDIVTPAGGTWTAPFAAHGKVTELQIA